MREFPIVTISLINYNGKKFVFQAIESAVNQDYPNLEIIVIDNNSTDGTREEIEKKIPEWKERREEIVRSYKLKPELQKPEFQNQKSKLQKPEFQNLRAEPHSEAQTLTCEESVKYIKNTENAGFGRPHNMAIRVMKGDFILLLNYDAILTSGYIKNVLKPFEDKKIGVVQGKLLRYDFDKNELRKGEGNSKLNIIDTVGLMMFKNRRIVCIGQGETDKGQYEEEKEIFGADGAVPVYRKEMLEDIKLPIINQKSIKSKTHKVKIRINNLQSTDYNPNYEYFDEDFFMYKEDVDLAWRARLAGWKAVYTPKAVAYHGRGSGDSMAKNYFNIIKERRKINNQAKFLSFKHQRLMQIKNDFPSLLFIKHFSQFIIKEVGAWGYMMIFERFTWRVLRDLHKDIPLFLKKRKLVMSKKRVDVKEMERWFN